MASSSSISDNYHRSMIAILDFGSQYSHLIARRIRELNVYCELFSCLVDAKTLETRNIKGVILSGGPNSVYDPDSPHVSECVWKFVEEKKIPILGICYGMQELAYHFNGEVLPSKEREYGRAYVNIDNNNLEAAELIFSGVEHSQMWMSHGDKVTRMPEGFVKIAYSDNCEQAAIANVNKLIFGLQFHPEVTHSIHGKEILRNFAIKICKADNNWEMKSIAEVFINQIREKVGPDNHVIGAVSGGVDSSVAALLMKIAVGNRFHAIMVDSGCLRTNETERVKIRLQDHLGVNLTVVDASEQFLNELTGVSDPEMKRKIIGRVFIEVFQKESKRISSSLCPNYKEDDLSTHKVKFLLQGTLYPDVIESVSYKGPSATIKTHHNVGGLPDTLHLDLIEPLRDLFKDEVRELGLVLGLDKESVWRHPFPGPGLAIRVLGEVTKERLDILRAADKIMIDEIRAANVYQDISQAFAVLLPVKSVGVMGDSRTYESALALRCVTSTDFMTADWYHMDYALLGKISSRICNEVKGINRVCYDISSKPPATIEWE